MLDQAAQKRLEQRMKHFETPTPTERWSDIGGESLRKPFIQVATLLAMNLSILSTYLLQVSPQNVHTGVHNLALCQNPL